MAVTSVTEFGFGEGRGADIGGIDDSTATRLFRVHVDSAQDSFDTVLQAGLLPTIFSVHPNAPGMTVRRLRPTHTHKLVWVVSVEYSSAPISKEKIDRELQPNPTTRRAKIEWITSERLVVASKDANGKPYVTSAGEEYDAEDRQRPVTDLAVAVRKNFADLPPWILLFNNKRNEAEFSVRGVSFPQKTLLMKNLRIGDQQQENSIDFLEVAFELHYDPTQWVRSLLDRGWTVKDPNDATKRVRARLDGGELPQKPVLLDGSGNRLANPSNANAVYNEFEDHPTLDYGPVSLLVI